MSQALARIPSGAVLSNCLKEFKDTLLEKLLDCGGASMLNKLVCDMRFSKGDDRKFMWTPSVMWGSIRFQMNTTIQTSSSFRRCNRRDRVNLGRFKSLYATLDYLASNVQPMLEIQRQDSTHLGFIICACMHSNLRAFVSSSKPRMRVNTKKTEWASWYTLVRSTAHHMPLWRRFLVILMDRGQWSRDPPRPSL